MQASSVNLQHVASKVVNDCLRIKKGENVWISCADPYYCDFAEEVALAVVEAEAYPFITLSSDKLNAARYKNSHEYLSAPPVITPRLIETADVYLQLAFPRDPDYLKGIAPDKLGAASVAGLMVAEAMQKRNSDRANLRCSSFLFPTPEAAAKYGIPYGEYAEMIWGAIDIDYEALSLRAKKIAGILRDAEDVHITTEEGTDLRFSVKGRKILIDDGVMDEEDIETGAYMQNLPTGEVYCAPVEATAEGTAVFQYNVFMGEPLVNLRTTFREGRMTDMSADSGLEHFHGIMEKQHGEKYRIAELGIGLNPRVTRVIGDLAMDEKIIGTIHIAVGENRMFKGENEASIHWDLVMMNPTLVIDGLVVMENGEYRV